MSASNLMRDNLENTNEPLLGSCYLNAILKLHTAVADILFSTNIYNEQFFKLSSLCIFSSFCLHWHERGIIIKCSSDKK